MNVQVEIEVTKVWDRVYLRVKYMQFEKAAQMGFHLMPGSIDEEHCEMIQIVYAVYAILWL